MSRFYGRVRGQAKTEATRRGGPTSGLVTECNGWDVGVECRATVDPYGRDRIAVWVTAGSNGSQNAWHIGDATLTPDESKFAFFPVNPNSHTLERGLLMKPVKE